MGREIKFRGLRTDGKGWVYGYYSPVNVPILGTLGHCINEGGYRAIDIDYNSLGQYAGLQERGKKDVYEGDLLINPSGDIGLVVFYEGGFYLKCPRKSGQSFYVALTSGFLANKTQIGNIYQNHELLKGGLNV